MRLLLSILFSLSATAWAESALPLQFGGEFTVTTDGLQHANRVTAQYDRTTPIEEVHRRIKESHRRFFDSPDYLNAVSLITNLWSREAPFDPAVRSWDLRIRETYRDVRRQLTINDKIKIDLGVDQAVLEFPIGPYTIPEFEAMAPVVQHYAFDLPATRGFEPAAFAGGGHISIGYRSFGSRLLVKNFMVDSFNHGEIGLGGFGFNDFQAISPWMMPKNCLETMQRRLRNLNANEDYPEDKFVVDIEGILRIPGCADKRQVMTFRNETGSLDDARFEFRVFNPQRSMWMFLRQIRLLNGRVDFLRTKKGPIQLLDSLLILRPERDRHPLESVVNPPVFIPQARNRFRRYVREAGQDPKEHQDYWHSSWDCEGNLK